MTDSWPMVARQLVDGPSIGSVVMSDNLIWV